MAAVTTYQLHRGGSGTPLVLLHGLNLSWRIWQPVIPLLEAEHSVLAPTLAGHLGGPPLAAGSHGIGPVADAVEELLDAEGVDRAHLVGFSLGGWLACELAHRGRGASVVAFSPAGAWQSRRDGARVARLMRSASRRATWPSGRLLMSSPALRRQLLAPAMVRGDLVPTDVAIGMVDEIRSCMLLEGLLGWLGPDGLSAQFDIDSDCPVRLAWPARDRTIPYVSYGRAFRSLLPPTTELVALRGIGHIPTYDDPALVARTVLEVTRGKNPPSETQPPTTGGRSATAPEPTVERSRQPAVNQPSGPHQEVHR